MGYKSITLIFSLLLLTYTLAAQETGTLYLKKVNGKIGWSESGNPQKNWKYTGVIFDGEPNGNGVLRSPFEEYIGEFKNGKRNGKGTLTYLNGTSEKGIWKDNNLIESQ